VPKVVISAMRPPSRVDEGSSLHLAGEIRLKETSTLAATASTCESTARSSVTSRTASSAEPPAARISAATVSIGPWVRPARKTAAPSRAKVLATPPPIPPPAP
jgi:hypothetical protein